VKLAHTQGLSRNITGITSSGYWSGIYNDWPSMTPYGITGSTLGIARIAVGPGPNGFLPHPLEIQTVYYIRRFASGQNFIYRVYATAADAQANANWIVFDSFAAPKYFKMFYVSRTYAPILCEEWAEENEDLIACCIGDQPNENKNLYDNIILDHPWFTGRWQHVLQDIADNYLNLSYSNLTRTFPSIATVPLSASQSASLTLRFDFRFAYNGTPHILDINVYAKESGSYYYVAGARYESNSTSLSFSMATLGAGYENSFWQQQIDAIVPALFPAAINITIPTDSKSQLPPTCRLYMPDAYFFDNVSPINLGLQDHILTLHEPTSTYMSSVLNLHNIPGRLHLRVAFYPLESSGNRHAAWNGPYLVDQRYPSTPALRSNLLDTFGTLGKTIVNLDNANAPIRQDGLMFYRFDSDKVEFDSRYSGGAGYGPIGFQYNASTASVYPIRGAPDRTVWKFGIAYSQYMNARWYHPYAAVNESSVFQTNFYTLISNHPSCYVASL